MRIEPGLRRLVFVLLCAAIVGVGSERMFWFWATGPVDYLMVTLVYSPAVAGVLWLVNRHRVGGNWGLLLVAPVMGLLVEGVVTPIVYSGGPFVPFFPVWFGAWHGVLSIVVLLFGFRRWLLTRNWRRLLLASTLLGVFWGTWSITLRLPESVGDPEMIADHGGPLHILDPSEFTLYALAYSAILAAAHLLLGRGGWMSSYEPTRLVKGLWVLVTAGIVVAWTAAIPWAAPMFVAYLGLQVWGLRRYERVARAPSLFELLDGRFPVWALWPIAALPAVASATYALWWSIDVPEAVVRNVFMNSTIAVQTIVGAVLFVAALRRAGRPPAAPTPAAWAPPDVRAFT